MKFLTSLLAVLFLAYFTATAVLYFLHEEGLFRFEFGVPVVEQMPEDQVFDLKRTEELFRREQLIKENTKKLELRENAVTDLRRQIELERKKINEDREALTETMKEISEKFAELTAEEEAKLQQLSNLYSKMKAQRVSVIFNEMDSEMVSELLTRMKAGVSAKILGQMGVENPKRAAEISDIMKGKVKRDLFNQIPQI